jgi:hypothetical protein
MIPLPAKQISLDSPIKEEQRMEQMLMQVLQHRWMSNEGGTDAKCYGITRYCFGMFSEQ